MSQDNHIIRGNIMCFDTCVSFNRRLVFRLKKGTVVDFGQEHVSGRYRWLEIGTRSDHVFHVHDSYIKIAGTK